MKIPFLYRRLVEGVPGSSGTLSEPNGTAEPRFALQSTVNWMRALAILSGDAGSDWAYMLGLYARIERATLSEAAVNTVFEQLLMALHHLSALRAIVRARSDYDLARIGIMTWYYGIYCAASAMVAAKDGSQQDDHTATANQWDRQIAANGLAAKPFDLRLTTMVKKDADAEITVMRGTSRADVNSRPVSLEDARGACASYLNGTRAYYEYAMCERLKSRELKALNLSDFRTKKARELRDERLQGKSLGFVHQAFRYRGKANYRDALFLTYEAQVGTVLDGFTADLETVLRAFVTMAGAFCSMRLPSNEWNAFTRDMETHLKLAVMPGEIWSA